MKWFILLVLCCAWTSFAARNLIANPGMEGARQEQLPPHWTTQIIGIAPQFAVDKQIRHGGQSSIRISATDVTRAYVRSEPIEVAPGETIAGSVWVKWQDSSPPPAHFILIAEFTEHDGSGRIVQKIDTADSENKNWQKITGETVAPANVTQMRLLIGFAYARGAAWVDDAEVWTPQPLVARMLPLRGKLTPALEEMPVMVMNRNGQHGPARVELMLAPPPKPSARPATQDDEDDEVDPDKKPVASALAIRRAIAAMSRPGAERHTIDFVLDGSPSQIVNVPLEAQRRGQSDLYLLLERAAKNVFGAYQAVKVPPPLVLEPPLPTHWVIEDGKPHFQGLIDLALANRVRDSGTLRIELLDAKGNRINQWTPTTNIQDGATPYSFDAPTVGIGKYKIVAHFIPRQGKEITAEQNWAIIPRGLASVTINAPGYPVYDGHAIFPLGMFNGSLWDGLQAGGFTVSHAYNATGVVASQPPDDLAAQRFLDESEAHGLKALFLIPRGYAFAGQWDAFRRRIRMFKNHPALLAWDEEEGIARGDLTPANFARMIQIIREEDPYHPIMVGDSRDTISRMGDRSNFFPAKLMDMGMWWWYPFPLKNISGGALQGDEAASSSELILPTFLMHRNTDKPIWVGVQSYRQAKNSPYPTPAEYRAQAYAALCAGAKGLMWYGGGVTRGLQGDPKAAHWKDLQKIVKEISERCDFWMEPASQTPRFTPANIPMSVMIKRHDGQTIMVAVNRSVQAAEVAISISGSTTSANVVGENRIVKIIQGKLDDRFTGLDVHVYELNPEAPHVHAGL